jgi:hypothetical protein
MPKGVEGRPWFLANPFKKKILLAPGNRNFEKIHHLHQQAFSFGIANDKILVNNMRLMHPQKMRT